MSDHVSYLRAKRELDDRALNRDVLSAFADSLPEEPTVLEVGCGTATMPERFHEWGVIESGRWVAVDTDADAIEAGKKRLSARSDSTITDAGIRVGKLCVESIVTDAFEYVGDRKRRFDAVVGTAFFDIVDVERAVSALGEVADLVYAPITYDGTTTFEPADGEDEAVLERYREHMCFHRPGSPHGARRLRAALSSVESVGPSPWEIEPPYTDGERIVIEHVLETIESAVAEVGYDAESWADRRRRQLRAEKLRYRADNVDVLGRLPTHHRTKR